MNPEAKMKWFWTFVVAGVLSGCGGAPAPAEAPSGEAPTAGDSEGAPNAEVPHSDTAIALVEYIDKTPQQVLMSPRNGRPGLDIHHVSVDGVDVWPPTGEGCEALVQCCEDIVTTASHLALVCMFAVVRDGACSTALETVNTVADEQSLSKPASCGPDA